MLLRQGNEKGGLLLKIRKSRRKGMLVKNERRGGAYQVSICEHLSWGSNTGNAPLPRLQ